MVFLTESERPFSKLIDDNSYHIKGQARLRIVHAAAGESGRALVPFINGQPWGSNTAIAYGQATENRAITSGAVDLDLHDISGKPLVQLPEFEADEKELKTVFVIGDDELRAMQYSYEPSEAPSGNSRVRVFNSGDEPLDVMIEDEVVLRGVEPGTLSPYVNVAAVFGTDERQDAELAIYSLRTGEDQVAWSPDSKKLAFVGSPDGQMDIYVTSIDGPATRVSSDDWREVNPRWSPDGKSLVWEALDERLGEHHIGVLLAGEKEPHFVDMSSLRSQLGWDAGTVVVFPEPIDWATNRLVYLYPKADRGPGGIWVYDIGSDTLRQLYDGSILGPDYSPEAESWAFGTNEGQLYTLSTSGDLQRLPADDGYYPLWSPDGSKISWVEGGPLSETGWRIHVVNADGSGDVALTDWLPVLQSEPPVPGPNAKRWWLSDGEELAFTRAGRDYGAADRAGGYGVIEAGDDIENVWIVPTDGSESPRQATDLVKVFYLKEPIESEDGSTFGLVGFSYRDRVVQLWTVPRDGGKPVKIDGPVRWFAWSD
jgi:Tol biopolymer transport system component